jgi:hypothetical protein
MQATTAFPTPPSSASTPELVGMEDHPPPRKRARYTAPTAVNSEDTVSRQEESEETHIAETISVRIPRIRIKMSETQERRGLTRLQGSSHGEEEEGEMESDGITMTPLTQEQVDVAPEEELRWEDQEVREMVEAEESWRVIGLSNVGNTCFTNAILQVFSSIFSHGSKLTIDKRRFWKNISFDGMNIFHHP